MRACPTIELHPGTTRWARQTVIVAHSWTWRRALSAKIGICAARCVGTLEYGAAD